MRNRGWSLAGAPKPEHVAQGDEKSTVFVNDTGSGLLYGISDCKNFVFSAALP